MPETTAPAHAAKTAWGTILGKLATAEGYACVIAARSLLGPSARPEALVAEYHRLRTSGKYTTLNAFRLSAGQLADLAVVVNASAAGVNATSINGNNRRFLVARELVRVVDRQGRPTKSTATGLLTVRANLGGVAVVRAAQGKPVELTEDEAMPLLEIEQAMRTHPSGGSPVWPGSDLTLRIALLWRLAEKVRVPQPSSGHWAGRLGAASYQLTPAGVDALTRMRERLSATRREANPVTAAVLELVRDAHPHGRVDFTGRRVDGVRQCLDRAWIKEGQPRQGLRTLHLTEDGREALARYQHRQQAAAQSVPNPRKTMLELAPGMWVRLSNRSGTGVTPEWVRVEHITHLRDTNPEALAGNYELWATTDTRPDPFLYPFPTVYRTTKFDVRPL